MSSKLHPKLEQIKARLEAHVAPPSEEVSPVEVTVTPEVVVITVTPAPVEYT